MQRIGEVAIVNRGTRGCKSTATIYKKVDSFIPKKQIKHGHAFAGMASRTYISWRNMLSRCRNKNNRAYPDYGGRGIIVCKRWLKFENFLADMGEIPNDLELERNDNNGNYCKENCRWATSLEQNGNKRNNLLFEINGETKHFAEWCRVFRISRDVVRSRLKLGWDIEPALKTPVRCKKQKL
jgi:hypothetical protein